MPFFERTLHIDGGARQSTADASCHIILLVASEANPPCRLDQTETAAARSLFAAGAPGVWVRRNGDVPGTISATNLRQ